MNFNFTKAVVAAIIFSSCAVSSHAQESLLPADKNATKETVALYRNLAKLRNKGYMFGHQDDLAYGVKWHYEDGRSDVQDVTGDYPAVYGWDMGGLELKSETNIDGVPFKKMRQYIKDIYAKGGVITLSWHFRSPLGEGKSAWDTTHGTVTSILPGGQNNELFKSWLDEAAKFISTLKGPKGELIPVLYRPFHEFTGNWFWWCKNTCTPFEFKSIYRYVVYYLQQEKKLHNILFVYNTSDNFTTKEEFLDRYPGDDVVDVLSYDSYQFGDPATNDDFVNRNNKLLKLIGEIGTEKNKLTALAETGFEAIPFKDWWTHTLERAIGDNKISYVLVWRNNYGINKSLTPPRLHYYAPFKGQVSADDFIKFYDLDKTLFQKDVTKENLYK
jgi:mannan endo-1,4-beta-mannosidase